MTRVFLTAVTLATFPLCSRAGEAAVRLNVQPMPAAKPALKYQLLPEWGELKPGNAAQNYLKCFMEQRDFFYNKESTAERDRYQIMPLAELPLDRLRDYGGSALRRADWAARLATIDWQIPERVQDGCLGLLPAEVGPLQVLGEALRVRFRAEVAGRRFDDAVTTAKTMFALGRHLGEYPTEIANQLGLWVAHVGLDTLREMVQEPGCPNLYWALANLPCPIVDVRKGVQGDLTLVAAELRLLHDDGPMSETEIDKLIRRLSSLRNISREQAGRAPLGLHDGLRAGLQARGRDRKNVAAARLRLIEAGCARVLVERFPSSQIILLYEKRDFEIQRDERIKLLGLPVWQIDIPTGGDGREPGGDGLLADFLPHIVKLRRAQGQLEREVALLRHVEALRLYATEHDGKLPANSSDIHVPLPIDPFTGKPFDYAAAGATAHIRGGSPPGEVDDPRYAVHYLVTLRK
jgi:hypothetical protein